MKRDLGLFLVIFTLISSLGFSQDGSPDTPFGDNGVVISNLIDGEKWLNGIDQSLSGRILISGYNYDPNLNEATNFILAYHEDGSFDISFGDNGILLSDGNDQDYDGINITIDEKVLLGSNIGGIYTITRLLPNGDTDVSFGNSGNIQPFANEVSGRNMILDQDNNILVIGIDNSGAEPNLLISKFLSSGAIDSSFGNNGLVTHPLGNVTSVSAFSLLLFNNYILIGVRFAQNNVKSSHIIRYLLNGSLDGTFGNNGIAQIPIEEEYFCSLSVFNDGSFLIGGFYYDFQIKTMIRKTIKLNPDTTPNENFGNDGILNGFSGEFIQENQRFISNSSYIDFEGGISMDYARFFQNGAIDSGFQFSTNYIELGSAFFQPLNSGKFLIAGNDIWYNGPEINIILQRFNNNPLNVSEFNLNALKIFPNPSSDTFVVQLSNTLARDLSYQITDVSGKQILKGTLSGFQTIIDLSSFQSGIYFLNTSQGSVRLIKN